VEAAHIFKVPVKSVTFSKVPVKRVSVPTGRGNLAIAQTPTLRVWLQHTTTQPQRPSVPTSQRPYAHVDAVRRVLFESGFEVLRRLRSLCNLRVIDRSIKAQASNRVTPASTYRDAEM
jgi:hypothetical protein